MVAHSSVCSRIRRHWKAPAPTADAGGLSNRGPDQAGEWCVGDTPPTTPTPPPTRPPTPPPTPPPTAPVAGHPTHHHVVNAARWCCVLRVCGVDEFCVWHRRRSLKVVICCIVCCMGGCIEGGATCHKARFTVTRRRSPAHRGVGK